MKLPPLDQAPLHIRAIALAAWAEWLTDGRKSHGFSITLQVRGKKANVSAYNPLGHAWADGESGETDFQERQ